MSAAFPKKNHPIRKILLVQLLAFILIFPAIAQTRDTFGDLFGAAAVSPGGDQPDTPATSPGFGAPVPINNERTKQKDKDGRASGILSFYLKSSGDVSVNMPIDFGPWARYGYVKQAMIHDVNGYVMGGYTEQDDKDIRMAGPYRLYVEKWNDKGNRWEKHADYPQHTGGRISFGQEAYYRLSALPIESTVFSLSPQSIVVTVKDPALDRTGKRIIGRVLIAGIPAYHGNGVSLDCTGLPKYDHGAGFVPEYPKYTFKCLVQRGVVRFEASMNQMLKSLDDPEPYRDATWRLIRFEGKSGMKVVAVQQGGETFTFDTGYWGSGSDDPTSPGRYELEAHLAEKDQARGIQQMPVRPGLASITLFECGQGKHKPAEPETKTVEGQKKKDCELVVGAAEADTAAASHPDKTVCIEAASFQQKGMAQLNDQNEIVIVQQPLPEEIVQQNAPKDTPDVPVRISEDCDDLLRQIQRREQQIQIPCEAPVGLMNRILGIPQQYVDRQAAYADLWEASLRDVKEFYDSSRIVAISQEYARLVQTAMVNDLVMSEQDRQKYDGYRMGETGIPLSLGHGIAPTAAVFNPQKVTLLNRLRADQQRIFNEHADARRRLEAGLPALKEKIAERNRQLEEGFNGLLTIRESLDQGQTALADMFASGKFEHCLGMGPTTSMDYAITFADGRQERGAAWALPGMSLRLPEPKKEQVPVDNITVPAPLHKIMPLRLKIDGIRQAEQDRKTAEALAEAARLAFEVENGSWLNWAGSWCLWLLKPTGADVVMENIAAGNSVTESLAAAGVTLADRYGSVVGGIAGGIYDRVANKPLHEVMAEMDAIANVLNPGNLVPAIFEGLGEDVAKLVHSKTDVLKEIEALMDEQLRLGRSTQDNVKAIEIANRINELWGKMDEAGKAMNNIILTIATSGTALQGTKAIAGTKPLAKLQAYIDDIGRQLVTSQKTAVNTAVAIQQRALLEAKITQLEAARQSGQLAGQQVDEALTAAREALQKTGGAFDEAVAANQQAVKQLSDKLDEAVRNRASQLDELGKAPPPPTQLDLTPALKEQLKNGEVLGQGIAGKVIDVGDDKVAKVFTDKFRFDDEVTGLKTLREADVPHIPAKEVGSNVIIKEKFAANQQTLQDILDSRAGTGRVLTRQEQIEALEFYNNAAKKGVVFGDAHSGNLIKETLPDGSFRYLAVEGGSIAKVSPEEARKLMTALLDKSLITETVDPAYKAMLLADAVGPELGQFAENFLKTGFTMGDTNIAKHIDPDLLKTFLTDPNKWDEIVNGTRKAQALATDAVKKLQSTVEQTAAAVNAASSQLGNSAADLQQQINNLSSAAPVQIQSGSVMSGAGQTPVIPAIPAIGPQSSLSPSTFLTGQTAQIAA